MSSSHFALVSILLAVSSGAVGMRRTRARRGPSALVLGAAGLAAMVAAALALFGPSTLGVPAATPLAGWHGSLRVDGLSAVFLAAAGFVSGAAGLFGMGYWRDHEHPMAPWTRVFLGFLVAGILGVVSAGDVLTFLIAWEVMALASFALVATNHRHHHEARAAAWLYLTATRAATLSLMVAFVLLAGLTGSLAWTMLPGRALGTPAGVTMLVLFLFGFGLKAGAVPLHFWLPPAHAAAPSHVSAVMSGLLIKTGVYGLCRLGSVLPEVPLWLGLTVFVGGALSSVLGVAWALGSHDLKRLLAYHSVENIGIILLGLGLSWVGRALGLPELVYLGLGAALLHVLNHALFKSLLFLGAGAVDHACHTRVLDRLGGLGRRMPFTASCFLLGAAAITALPPLNGFVSEWLLYRGLFGGLRAGYLPALFGLLALVLTGGLALVCFTKVAGVVFLGEPRTQAAALAREVGPQERIAMALLAGACVVVGIGYPWLAPWLVRAVTDVTPGSTLASASLLGDATATWLTVGGLATLATGSAVWLWQARRVGHPNTAGTWDCGYAEPTPRMQYTASSFAAPITKEIGMLLATDRERPQLRPPDAARATVEALFPDRCAFAEHPRDPVLVYLLEPLARATVAIFNRLRVVHPGWMHLYLLYIAVTLILLLIWGVT